MYHLQTDQAPKVAAEQRADRMRGSQRSRMASAPEVEKAGRNRAAALRTVLAVLILAGVLALWAGPLQASHVASHLAQPSYALPQGYFIQEKMYRPPAAQREVAPGLSVPYDYFLHEKTDRPSVPGSASNLKPLTEFSADEATAYRWQAMASFYAQQAGPTAMISR